MSLTLSQVPTFGQTDDNLKQASIAQAKRSEITEQFKTISKALKGLLNVVKMITDVCILTNVSTFFSKTSLNQAANLPVVPTIMDVLNEAQQVSNHD